MTRVDMHTFSGPAISHSTGMRTYQYYWHLPSKCNDYSDKYSLNIEYKEWNYSCMKPGWGWVVYGSIENSSFLCWNQNFPGEFRQHHGCRGPGFLCCQIISSCDTQNVSQVHLCLPWRMRSTSSATSVLKQIRKCNYILCFIRENQQDKNQSIYTCPHIVACHDSMYHCWDTDCLQSPAAGTLANRSMWQHCLAYTHKHSRHRAPVDWCTGT